MARPDEQGQPSSEEPEAFIGQEGLNDFEGQVLDDLEGEGAACTSPVPAACCMQQLEGAEVD